MSSRGGRRGYGPRAASISRAPFRSPPAPRRNVLLRNGEDWRSWGELSVRITGLPPFVTTANVYETFSDFGAIIRIQIDTDRSGSRTGVATVAFSPPPSIAFWDQSEGFKIRYPNSPRDWNLEVSLCDKKRSFEHPSPVSSEKMYPERIVINSVSLGFGFIHAPDTMKIMRTLQGPNQRVHCVLDLLRRRVEILFNLDLENLDSDSVPAIADNISSTGSSTSHDSNAMHTFMIRIPLQQLKSVVERDLDSTTKELIIPLEAPPQVFRKTHDIERTQLDDPRHWNEQWTWYRQTDIPGHDPNLRKAAIALAKPTAIIDIGRWTTYRLLFDKPKINMALYNEMGQALRDYNIDFSTPSEFHIVTGVTSTLWDWIDGSQDGTSASNSWMLDMVTNKVHLPFRLRYQLEVCITQGFLNEHNITGDFVDRLRAIDEQEAVDRLEYVAELRKRLFDPMEMFTFILPGTSSSRKIPSYCVYARSANITPSTIYYSSPTVETSNRIIRQWQEHSDRFLRVRFTDEKHEGKVRAPDNATYNAVYARIKRCLKNGIMIGDRRFEFLAWGNSQFREHGAYFFASTPGLSADMIRGWMGDLRHIKSISRHASRLGQCFSTTRAINGTKVKIVEIADVAVGKYVFTDGVGKISRFLAQVIAAEMGLPNPSDDPPSVFQFRMGGCKGVLALEPNPKIVGMREVHIRESQYKFAASHEGLEVIRYSSFATATLNRQLIAILSCLEIPDRVFLVKLEAMLKGLEEAMVNEKVALSMLQKQIDPNQTTLTIASIMLDGFMRAKDPFAVSLLHLWRAWTIKALKEKAGIVIEKGAFVLGCSDETQTLRGHFNAEKNSIPEIFIQVSQPVSEGPNQYKVIEGVCIVARNPSLHPGDIRVVRAVNVPALRHLKNVVVFAQTGDRDVPSMCSGGDLDGDDFFVSWDESLIPPRWNQKPMNFESSEPTKKDGQVNVDDVIKFFVTYMQNDKLGSIATAALASSDWYELGAKSDQCIELAKLHSIAVDYPKSGRPAKMPRYLRPPKYPHFMESKYRAKDQIYHSTKILGQLYDKVQRVDFHPLFGLDLDPRVLNAFQVDDKMLQDAARLKSAYDSQMRRIMAQHEIQTEFEVWTTFVLSHAQLSKDYSFHEEMGRIKGALVDRFQKLCYEKAAGYASVTPGEDTSEKADGRDFSNLGPFVAAMYTVTDREVRAARSYDEADEVHDGGSSRIKSRDMPLMSFPWLFPKELGKIANGDIVTQSKFEPKHMKRYGIRKPQGPIGEVEDVETAEGIKHQGDLLELNFTDIAEGPSQPTVKASDSEEDEVSDESEYLSADEDQRQSGPVSSRTTLPKRVTTGESSSGAADLSRLSLESPDEDEEEEDEEEEEEEEEEEVEIDIDEGPSALDQLGSILGR